MKAPLIFFLIACSVALFFPYCFSECESKSGSKEYEELFSSSTQSNNSQVSRFSKYPYDEQITIFLYARDCPDDPRIRPMLIADGGKKVEAIVSRIESEEKVWDKAHLAEVLVAVKTECRCISENSEVVKRLELVGARIDADREISPNDSYKLTYHRTVEALNAN